MDLIIKSTQAVPTATQAPPIPEKELANPMSTNTAPNTPLPYSTAPSTPFIVQQQGLPIQTQASYPTTMNGIVGQVGPTSSVGASPPLSYGAAPAAVTGIPAYPGAIPMQPLGANVPSLGTNLPAMGINPGMAGMGTNPNQAGGINLVVNTNANSNTNSSPGATGGVNGAQPRPAPRPCPKCRMGYITRGQARCREICIKALAYSTICLTCLLPLQLLKTNYVDKCSYCGEEYGFRGELFEKPRPPKV
ncbi:hypothetical protein DICVIV_01744 [Dictyocaulus viviparus]|uniref:LITAF domain-containing protein n=1 Tax=Dictyocaulus viviparus TaxID=29172 RepID=A0A0D8Y592_DICVI|nr:hypothetical protein DICVIV_01744 [Dictyocaulus viviparus]